jgi:hypothetical protein
VKSVSAYIVRYPEHLLHVVGAASVGFMLGVAVSLTFAGTRRALVARDQGALAGRHVIHPRHRQRARTMNRVAERRTGTTWRTIRVKNGTNSRRCACRNPATGKPYGAAGRLRNSGGRPTVRPPQRGASMMLGEFVRLREEPTRIRQGLEAAVADPGLADPPAYWTCMPSIPPVASTGR